MFYKRTALPFKEKKWHTTTCSASKEHPMNSTSFPNCPNEKSRLSPKSTKGARRYSPALYLGREARSGVQPCGEAAETQHVNRCVGSQLT